MNYAARSDYLTTEVLTAAPQKLRLMLIEAAIRLVHQARRHWDIGQDDVASENLIRCQEIVAELVAGLRAEQTDSDLVRKVAGVYLFIHRSLVAANLERSPEQLDEALNVLEIERETWIAVCKQLGNDRPQVASGTSFEA